MLETLFSTIWDFLRKPQDEVKELREWVSALAQVGGLVVAFVAWRIARTQLVPLRKGIEQIAAERNRARRMRDSRRPPAREHVVVGFDPRFTNAEWNGFLGSHAGRQVNISMRLSNRHDDFHASVRSSAPFPKSHILLIDLMKVPEYLRDGHIASLSGRGRLDFDALLQLRAEAYGRPVNDQVAALMRLMASNEAGEIGAIPIWINTQGRMIPEQQLFSAIGRAAAGSSLDQLRERSDAKDIFGEAGIQSFYITFEFWAHLAYRGCCLFRPISDRTRILGEGTNSPTKRRFVSDLLNSTHQLEGFSQAVADIATRLRYSRLTRDVFQHARTVGAFREHRTFDLGHWGDARMIRDSLALWKPVFSSELLTRATPRREGEEVSSKLFDETNFKLPFLHRLGDGSWSYLSALGGYGLALPAAAHNDKDAWRAVKYLFLSNPVLMHSYVAHMLDEHTSPEDFFIRHGRPRWPFWSVVEDDLTLLLFQIFLLLDRSQNPTDVPPDEFWKHVRRFVADESIVRGYLRDFLDRVRLTAEKDRWSFDFEAADVGNGGTARTERAGSQDTA
jgi:hypothetical protein